jgi:hypothetical protein
MADAFLRAGTEVAVSIPEIWSAKIYEVLVNNLVGKNLVNQDYAGDIRAYGDRVHIVTVPEGGSATAVTEGTAVDADATTQTENVLVIDKQYAYDVAITDLAMVQSNLNLLQAYSNQIGFVLQKQLDSDIITALSAASAAAPDHIIAGTGVGGIFNPPSDILAAKDLLDAQNVPEDGGRWILMNPADYNKILADSSVQSRDYVPGQPLVSGMISPIFGFTPYKSNQLAEDTVLFGHTSACTLAIQKELTIGQYDMKVSGQRATRLTADILYGIKLLSDVRVVKLNTTGA